MLELFKTAGRLADSARANELAAWELTARESLARKKMHAIGSGQPWIVQPEDGKKKRGRPRKDRDSEVLEAIQVPAVGTDLTVWAQEAKLPVEGTDDTRAGSGTESQDGGSQE